LQLKSNAVSTQDSKETKQLLT